jgi:large repetitive protein
MNTLRHRRTAVTALAGFAALTAGLGLTASAASAATPAPTRTVLSAGIGSTALGQSVKLKAIVKVVVGTGHPTGTVTFSEGATVLGSVPLALVGSVETAKLTVPGLTLGDHALTATYTGSATFATSTSLPLTVTVGNPATATSVFNTTPNVVIGAPTKLKAVVKVVISGMGTPSGDVTFNDGATVLGTAPLALVGTAWTAKLTVPNLSLGGHQVTATYNGSGALAASTSKPLTVTVSKGSTTTSATPASNGGGAYDLNVQVKAAPPASGLPTGTVSYVVDGSAPQILALNAFAKANLSAAMSVGVSHTVTVSYSGDSMFAASQTTVTFTG